MCPSARSYGVNGNDEERHTRRCDFGPLHDILKTVDVRLWPQQHSARAMKSFMGADKASHVEVTPLDVDAALIEEFRRVGPHWLPPDNEQPTISATLAHLHAQPPARRPMALCLSGGGIRSATFCLGVLQSFARSGRLPRFDYLSSVSGGGYIASWLVAWLRHEDGRWDRVVPTLADGIATQATTTRRPRTGAERGEDPVSRLRAYSNYLSPVWGLSADALSLVAIFLRNMLLNLCVWLPLLLALTLLPRLYIAALAPHGSGWVTTMALAAAALVVLAIAFTVTDLPDQRKVPSQQRSHFVPLCFVPLVLAAMCVSMASAWSAGLAPPHSWPHFMVAGAWVHVVGIGVGMWWRLRRGLLLRDGATRFRGFVVVVIIGALGGLLLWRALQSPLQTDGRDGTSPVIWATASVPGILGCYWLALGAYAGFTRRWAGEDEREWWSRATGWWLLASFAWILLFGLTLHLPLWLFDRFGGDLPDGAELGMAGSLLGVATALVGYWSKNGANLKRRAEGLLQAAGLRLLDVMAVAVIVLLVLMLSLFGGWLAERCHGALQDTAPLLCPHDLQPGAAYLRQEAFLGRTGAAAGSEQAGEALAFGHVLRHGPALGIAVAVAVLVLFAAFVSNAIGANTFSLHGMYGNRLVRAYLGATRARRRPHWFTGFDPADNLPLDDHRPDDDAASLIRPFHVINMALNLVAPSDRRLSWQQRRAASFTATPLRCGTDGLGYLPAWAYGGERGMSLGRALTISGAAASPNMGYHSSSFVTFVMALFNVRLGWWLPNPSEAGRARWSDDEPALPFWSLIDEAMGRTTDTRSSIYLSDGGHFENLGLYEMVRRRCHRIVVVDATCDPKFEYADLHDAVRKIRIDLGINIELPEILPGPARDTSHPRLLMGRIRYSARDGNSPAEDGWLYLIKPRMVGTEPPELTHYAHHAGGGESPFPHQSTADQFFDETQFESYRLLGMISAEECFPGVMDEDDSANWPKRPPGWSGVALKSAPEAGKSPCSPCAETSALTGGLLGGLQHLGGGAALATALTVGGTLGVVGTVTLSGGEVRLSAEDRSLLKEGLNVKLSGSELGLTENDRRLLREGIKLDVSGRVDTSALEALAEPARSALRDLAAAGQRLSAAADRLQRPIVPAASASTGDPGLTSVVADLRRAITVLNERLSRPLAVAGDPALPQLVERLDRLVERLGQPTNLESLRKEISLVTSALNGLKKSVDDASPRSNARGDAGGSR